MFKFLVAVSPDPDLAKIRTYCYGSVEHFGWIEPLGFQFERSYYRHNGKKPSVMRQLVMAIVSASPKCLAVRAAGADQRFAQGEGRFVFDAVQVETKLWRPGDYAAIEHAELPVEPRLLRRMQDPILPLLGIVVLLK